MTQKSCLIVGGGRGIGAVLVSVGGLTRAM